MATSGTWGYNGGMTELRFAPRHSVPPFMCEEIHSGYSNEYNYTIDDDGTPCGNPSPDVIRANRPKIIKLLRKISESVIWRHGISGDTCCVYAAINLVTNKIYVGATERGLAHRRSVHLSNARKGRPGKFYNSIRKHGENSFDFIILSKCKDFFDALRVEAGFIKSIRPEYNMTAGGGGIKGYRFTQEQIEKSASKRRGIPSKKKGIPLSDAFKKKVSDGVVEWWKDKINDKAYIDKLTISCKLANDARRRAVVCVRDGRVFVSATDAASFYGIRVGQVSYSCKHTDHKPRKIPKFRYYDIE